MKNTRLTIKINNYLPLQPEIVIPVDVMITPIYVDPEEVLLLFSDEGSAEWVENFERILNLIFNGSRSFDRLLSQLRIDFEDTAQRSALAYKYVLCYSTYWAGIKIYKDKLKSVSKTKNLGDFQVSYRGDQNTGPIDSMIKDAKDCLDSLAELLAQYARAENSKAVNFAFRKFDAKVHAGESRRWDYKNPELGISFAGNKRVLGDGSSYKTGAYYQYWMVGKLGYNNWGYDGQYNW